MDAVYYKSLRNTWFHQYLSGYYYSRNGEPFLMVKIDDIHNDNTAAIQKRNEACKTYKDLYQQQDMEPIRTFLRSFLRVNRHTLFYHMYWMGHVCDSNGVPFYLKNKVQFAYSKSYQNQTVKNTENFEKYMKKQEDIKTKNAQRKKKKAQQKKKEQLTKPKSVQSRNNRQSLKHRIRDDSGATYVGGKKPEKQITTRKRQPFRQSPFRDDTGVVFVGGKPEYTKEVSKRPQKNSRPKQDLRPPKSDDFNAFMNPDSRQINTRLTKNRKFRKKKSLKSKMRQLKMEMANLL